MKHIKEFLAEALDVMEANAKAGKEADRARAERRAEAEDNERRAVSDKVARGRQP